MNFNNKSAVLDYNTFVVDFVTEEMSNGFTRTEDSTDSNFLDHCADTVFGGFLNLAGDCRDSKFIEKQLLIQMRYLVRIGYAIACANKRFSLEKNEFKILNTPVKLKKNNCFNIKKLFIKR